jgi:tetratricopeptide (TPR) repeat protein
MKKTTKIIVGLAVFLMTLTLSAQDIDYNDISFDYIQLPMKPLQDKTIKNSRSKVVLKYMDDINAAKGSYQDRVKQAEEDYQKAMEFYYVQQKMADDQYNKEMDEWNKKSLAEKILLGDKNKPQKKYISQPYKQMPVEQKYQKSFDTEMLASKYFKLEGFNNAPGGLSITVKLLGFDSQDPELVTSTVSTTNAQKQQITLTKYKYNIKYKHPMGYAVDLNGNMLYEDFPIETTNYSSVITQEFDNQSALQSWWNGAKEGFLNNLQEKIVNDNCQRLGTIINNNYGYRKITHKTELMIVDEKENYNDIKDAYAAALAGYNALSGDMTKSAAIPNIRKAIDLWESAMKESNPESKKARIDRNVTKVLLVNLQQAYMWVDEYEKSQACFDKLMAMDPDKDNRKRAEAIRNMAADMKERWNANK